MDVRVLKVFYPFFKEQECIEGRVFVSVLTSLLLKKNSASGAGLAPGFSDELRTASRLITNDKVGFESGLIRL